MPHDKSTLRHLVYIRDNHRCAKCGSEDGLTLHHLVPIRDGGQNTVENLITLCSVCHRAWNLVEAKYIVLNFEDWLAGGEQFERALNAALIFRLVTTARMTGSSYQEIAAKLNALELSTSRGNAWKHHNVRDLVRRRHPEFSRKRSFTEIKWPNFVEALDTNIYRWWRLDRPIALMIPCAHGWMCLRYDFFTRNYLNKDGFKCHAVPVEGVYSLRAPIRVKQTRPFLLPNGFLKEAKRPSKIIIQSGDALRLAWKVKRGRYLFRGPVLYLPSSWSLSYHATWLPWQSVETMLLSMLKLGVLQRFCQKPEPH